MRAFGAAHLACGATKLGVGCGLQRGVRAAGCGGLAARLVGGAGHGDEFVRRCLERFASDKGCVMDILYLLIPLSVLLVLFILGGLWWAINRGQFDNIEQEGERILRDD
jgi:cbb3-type cytochrome oxidase maturation protein